MYTLEHLYEQLKFNMAEYNQMDRYNKAVSESVCDITEAKLNVKKSLKDFQDEAKTRRNHLVNKLKRREKITTRILKSHSESALACKPIGLMYNGYKEFISIDDAKKMYSEGCEKLDQFNPDTKSEEMLVSYNNIFKDNEYNQLLGCYGSQCTVLVPGSNVVINEKDKELTKKDISEAVSFLEFFDETINNKITCGNINDDLIITGFSNILRENATIKKIALTEMNSCMYYTTVCSLLEMQYRQAAHVMIKASSYDPRNLKESRLIQEMIDSEFACK